jgi:very-short-patch-repair endonuclease
MERSSSNKDLDSEAGGSGPEDPLSVASAEEAPTFKSNPQKAHLSPTQVGVVQLIDYVRVLVELADKPVWSLASYGNLALHEEELRNRIGIWHDLTDVDGPVYLKIERLRRIDPPEPPPAAKEWVTVGRDPFKEPVVQSLRTAVMTAAEVADLLSAGTIDPADAVPTLKPKPGQDLRDVVLRLGRFPEIKKEVEGYIGQTWASWADAERPRRETINIYDRLFSLQQALKLEGSDKPLEVVWGMGVARWKLPPHELDHPLVEQLVELEIDGAGAIFIRPRDLDPVIALKPFVAMENPSTDLVARFAREHFVKLALERDLSPFEKDTYVPVLRYACAQLDRAGRYFPDHAQIDDRKVPPAGQNLLVTDTWVVYARPRSENFFTADLERLRRAVEETAAVPGPAAALVTEPSDEPTYVPGNLGIRSFVGGFSAGGRDDAGAHDQTTPQQGQVSRFFFPKPFNEEQIAIVECLESTDVQGVVVQGPPGTGKTHTIANIICHYLATGRRVLVTSKSEGALAVLREHIPEGIRDLAISLLTSEREGLKQLEATVNLLASKITSLDPRPVERDIAQSEQRIVELDKRTERIDAEMRSFAEKHLRRIVADKDEDGILPIELAERIVRDRERYSWFPDQLGASDKPDFNDEDMAAVRSARKILGNDLAYIDANLLSVSDLPDAASLAAIHNDLANAARIERTRRNDAPVMAASESDALSRAEALLGAVDAIVAVHESCRDEPWLTNLYNAWRLHGLDTDLVQPVAGIFATLSEPVTKRVAMLSYAVATPDDAHTDSELMMAVSRAASGAKPFGWISFGKSEVRSAFSSIRILDKSPEGPEDWIKIAEVLSWKAEIATSMARWRALAGEFSLPNIPERPEDAARALHPCLEKVNAVEMTIRSHVPLVQAELGRLFPYGLDPSEIICDLERAKDAAASIRSEVSRHRFESARAKITGAAEKLSTCSGCISWEIAEFLSTSVGDPDLSGNKVAEGWSSHLRELERVRALRPHLQTVALVAGSVTRSGSALWAENLRTQPVTGVEDPWTPNDWHSAWNWACTDAYLRAIDGRARLLELDEQRRKAEEETRQLFHDVVRMRTLLTLKARITRRVDAALQMFLTAIRRIGKATGKSASRHRRDARDAMQSSYSAIPCWIMPTWRVSESLPATLGSFDLVIFDEASQSDIAALPALLRGSKVLIVGDDKQVSPIAGFIEEQKLRALRLHYLDGQPFGSLMLPGNSLYELALACYPGRRIMLKEHFRCVEPIIRFSFQFYTDEIVPVRLPKASERLSPPLIDVYVPHGRKDRSNRNIAEAEGIVDEVSRIVDDPKMAGRSIGIISLIGAKQAQLIQTMLLERIGEDAYLRHDIDCGDSAVFQGKEKDIMLLSMVECPETCTSKTALPFQQRFNVALSRARDREYLFHSVTEEMLKPDDLKAKALRHFKNPTEGRIASPSDLMALCQSNFEREVLSRLMDLGYGVRPQVKVGPYSIDLVVEGEDDHRLAIELDGDQYHGPERWAEDLARQRVMERVGWRFWRCWGSSFRLDPDGCMDDLIRSLNTMKIEPLGAAEAPTVWTEFRTISQKDRQDTFARSAAKQTEGMSNVVAVGNRIQIQGSDGRIRVVALTTDHHEPDLGFISVSQPEGAALLGAQEDEEIEFEINGKSARSMIIKIEK